jgi:hypothetical protein
MNIDKNQADLYGFILLSLFLVIAVITNPELEAHKQAYKEKALKIAGLDEETTANADQGRNIGKAMFTEEYFAAITRLEEKIDSTIEVENFFIFSLTWFADKHQKAVVGVGIFGYVYIIGKDHEFTIPLRSLN